MKKIVSLLVVLVMFMGIVPVRANPLDDGGNSGSGSGGSSVSGSTWTTAQSGYRVTIVDSQKRVVANVVDFMFNMPGTGYNLGEGDKYWYTNSRFTGLSNDDSTKVYKYETFKKLEETGQIDTVPQFPIYSSGGKLNAGGTYFKEWFLSGKYGMDLTQIPQKPKETPTSNKTTETGTTRPVPGSANYSTGSGNGVVTGYVRDQDMQGGYVSNIIAYQSGNRASFKSTAKGIVQSQGYIETADIKIKSLTAQANRMLKDANNSSGAVQRITDYLITNSRILGRSTAEQNYILASVLDEFLGYGRTPSNSKWGNHQVSYNDLQLDSVPLAGGIASEYYEDEILNSKRGSNQGSYHDLSLDSVPLAGGIASEYYEDKILKSKWGNHQVSYNDLQLDSVPAAGGISSEYYADEILNSKSGGKYNFQFNGTGIVYSDGVNSSKTPLEVIQANNFYVVVEPVFWFKPAQSTSSGGKFVKTNEQSYYVYGTVSNLVEHYKGVLGWDNGYFYQSLTNGIGWSSMYMEKDWEDQNGNVLMKGVGLSGDFATGVKSHSKLQEWFNGQYAIASHVYRTGSSESIQVTGFPRWSTPTQAPDPKDLTVNTGDFKKYNIIKYYEDHENGTVVHRYEPLYRSANPPRIDIVSELYHKVDDWFITSADVKSGAPAVYETAKSKYGASRTGKNPAEIRMGVNEITLVVQLVTKSSTGSGDIEISESKIAVGVSTEDAIVVKGLRGYSLPVFGRNIAYILSNTASLDTKLEANTNTLKPKMTGNTSNSNGGTLSNPKYETVLFRGYDNLTLYSPHVANTSPLRGLFNRYGVSPGGDRGENGVYEVPLQLDFNVSQSAGLTDDEKASITGVKYDGVVAVRTYRGVRDGKAIGDQFDDAVKTGMGMTIAGLNGNNGVGRMITNDDYISFYPYMRMTYQDTAGGAEKDAYVTSQWVSQMRANDFVEVNYGKASESNISIKSDQWSLHARAIDGGQSWNGENQVLPGGAIYDVTTDKTAVGVVTWQTVMLGAERDRLAGEISDNHFSLASAEAEHQLFVDEAKATLEGLEVYQWVNADPNVPYAWANNGRAVRVEPGVSLSPLGLRTKAAMDTKYQLNGDAEANRTLSVTGISHNDKVYYKVFSDTSGNVYLARSVGNVEAISLVNGFNLNVAGVSVTKVADKTIKASSLESILTGDAKAVDIRTKLITNFVTALERNAGNDTSASWASDGKWYNEAFDGVYVVRQQTNIRVGLDGKKVLALDPNLTPASSGKADLYKKAFVSQYKADNGGSNVIGQFKGQPVELPDLGNLFVSQKFYLPNALVTDGY